MGTNNVLNKTNYGSWKVFHPTGKLMFRCVEKRANWYLSRNLAEVIGDNEIKLLFTPKGTGEDHDGLVIKENRCVCCGKEDNLTRHHIVPREFRRHFPIEMKARNSYDVMLLCVDHHAEYEAKARILKAELLGDFDLYQARKRMSVQYERLMEGDINDVAEEKTRSRILTEFPDANFTMEDCTNKISLVEQEFPTLKVVTEYMKRNDLQSFVELWRKHFLDNLPCLFLPEGWRADKKISKVKV